MSLFGGPITPELQSALALHHAGAFERGKRSFPVAEERSEKLTPRKPTKKRCLFKPRVRQGGQEPATPRT